MSSRLIWIGDRLTLDVERQRVPTLRSQSRQRPRRGLERPAAERDDQARFLGDRDEFARRDRPRSVMLPARERLEAGDTAGRELDQRLEGERQLVGLDRAAQLGLDAEAAARRRAPASARRPGCVPICLARFSANWALRSTSSALFDAAGSAARSRSRNRPGSRARRGGTAGSSTALMRSASAHRVGQAAVEPQQDAEFVARRCAPACRSGAAPRPGGARR